MSVEVAVDIPVKFLEVPNDLVQRGKVVLTMEASTKYLIAELMKGLKLDIAKNSLEVAKLWKDVKEEITKQGITLAEDERLSFDYSIDKYFIAKRKIVETK